MDFFADPLFVTVVGGLVVSLVAFVLKHLFWKSDEDQKVEQTNSVTNSNVQEVVVNNNLDYASVKKLPMIDNTSGIYDPISLKARIKILFIEDEVFKKIDNLKKLGWNISQIKDVENLDMEEIRNAQIIFVDYKGVGKSISSDQGLGLIKALKKRYLDKKWLIFYSAHDFPLDVYDKGADSYLAKNSAEYEMEQKIMEGANRIIR